jgi:hypothetical protein
MRSRVQFFIYLAIALLIIFSQGCATPVARQFISESERPQRLQFFFDELDAAIAGADVRDASVFSVSGFPYLRANRFIASFKDRLATDEQKEQWVRWMQQLDLNARKKEIQNLPLPQIETLSTRFGELFDRKSLLDRATAYSDTLLAHDQGRPEFYATLQSLVEIPDEYSTTLRVVGLYPIISIPVAAVTRNVYRDFTAWHQLPRAKLNTIGTIKAYGPENYVPYAHEQINALWDRSGLNALGIPSLSEPQRQIVLKTYAPIFLQDVAASYDEIGELFWENGQIAVDSTKPVVYYFFSYAYFKGNPILQLNYVVWFSARDGPNSPRIERGRLDGLTVRISLDTDGHPFMVDIMNNCGCYHFFVPSQSQVLRVLPSPQALDAFVPRWLPETFPHRRLSIRVKSGWHQVDNLDTIDMRPGFIPYQLVPYERLEMLPRDGLALESMFNSKGIAKNTERIEPLIYFPMGIWDIGSMRQRGHHAIKFVGRVHFDDPDIFDDNFEFR